MRSKKKLVVPAIRTADKLLKQFIAQKYEPAVFEEQDKTVIYTIKGARVRSKSGIIIDNELPRYNVPYHYEMPIQLKYWGKKVTRRLDFTVINQRTGKPIKQENQ